MVSNPSYCKVFCCFCFCVCFFLKKKKQQGGGLGIKFVGEWGVFIFLPYTPQVYQGIFFLFMLICSDIKLLF